MNNKISQAIILVFVLLSSFSCSNNDIEDIPLAPIEYDPTQHIQATIKDVWSGEWYSAKSDCAWEAIIDLETGAFDTIPGTGDPFDPYLKPMGPDRLTDFENNRRIYAQREMGRLVVQDLESLEEKYVELKDPETGDNIRIPLYLDFGNSPNELFAFSYYNRIYRIDLETLSIELVGEITLTDIREVTEMIFSKASQRIILLGQTFSTSIQEASAYAMYDFAEQTIVREGRIPVTFGFVKHPTETSIFCLTSPNSEVDFRLIEFEIRMDGLFEINRSPTDLAINNISTHRSTIHSATNSYIVRGGSTHEFNLVTVLYQIDLETGELKSETMIDLPCNLLKIAGE